MYELIEQPEKKFEEISVMFVYTDGNTFTQQVPMKFAHMIEELLEWYRSKKTKPTWSWNFDAAQRIILFQKAHIVSIDINGYIELTRTTQKWYEKLFDKLITAIIFRRLKGGEYIGKESESFRKDGQGHGQEGRNQGKQHEGQEDRSEAS